MLVIPVVILGGLLLGWLASVILKTRYYHGVVLNLLIGVTSAVIFGHFFAPILGRPSIFSGFFSTGTVAIAMGGTAGMLLVYDLVRRAGSR